MVCLIETFERPTLKNPVLIEGLPGIGFVANIAALHLIHELGAIRFAEIHSSAFQDLAVTTGDGMTRFPVNELYYAKSKREDSDVIIWYGNTQALTTRGQYELCGRVLDMAEGLECKQVITLGGFRQEEVKSPPQIYCAATDHETVEKILQMGTKVMVGQVFGIAGIMVGLARLKGIKSFSLLVDTLGTYPDVEATRAVLSILNKLLKMDVDMSGLISASDETKKILESFGLIRNVGDEKKREEQQFRWFI